LNLWFKATGHHGTRGGCHNVLSLVAKQKSKKDIRRELRQHRRALPTEEQYVAAASVAVNLITTHWFGTSTRIACYLAADGELDLTDVLEIIWRRKKQAYLPVLSHMSSDRLWFAPAEPGCALRVNRLGILEPQIHRRKLIRAAKLDLILLPLVGFDTEGNRLGMGGGFYDRSLEFLRHRRYWRKPHLVGVAHEFQRVSLPTADPWDVTLDGIITDKAIYKIDR
jgi:5-formyltetrahydrofolate cyclo-ligase